MRQMHRFIVGIALALGGCASESTSFADLQYPEPVHEVGTVSIGNAQVAYTSMGEGERTLVLVHGLGSSIPSWSENVAALAREHRVVAIDLPGHGKSSKQAFSYSMEFFAEVLRGVVKELALERVVLVGHSMGGQIAMTYALQYPGEVEALVLASPAGFERFQDDEARWLARSVTPEFTCSADAETVEIRHARNFHRVPSSAVLMVEHRKAVIGSEDFEDYCRAVSRSVAGMLDGPVWKRLGEIAVPTVVTFGEYDAVIPNPILHGASTEKLAREAVDRMPGAELHMIEEGGHMAHLEHPQIWNELVLDFLRRHPDGGTTSKSPSAPARDGDEETVPLYEPDQPPPPPERS